MKNVKTMYRKLTMMVVLGVLLAVMSCNNLLTPPKGNSTDRDSGSGNVSEDGKVLITIKLFTGSARMVMPDIEQLDWHITAKQGTDNIEATGTYPTYTLELPTTGPWTFTVKGTKENKELFTGTVTENVSNSTTSISIPLSPGSGMESGTGTIDLTMTVPTDVKEVMYKLDSDTEFTGLTPSNGSCRLNKTDVSAGIHTLSLYFLDDTGMTVYMCTETVNVWNGMTSSQWINTGNIGYITGNGEFELTDVIIDAFLNTMGSVVYVNDSIAVNAPATGSFFAPVNSVSKAVDILGKANPDGNYSGTIMVSGVTTIDREIVVKDGETLTVKGMEAGASIKNTSGRVFNIASGGSLTLGENITLTGTVTNDNGGAVYVNGGTFTMKAGSKITRSSASCGYGGGVYVDSKGTFTMDGGAITENSASIDTSGNGGASGGGVCISNGTFTMSGGAVISGNNAPKSGGGVFFSGGGNFTMEGGTIGGSEAGSANSAENGGGVYIHNGTFTMSGSAVISGNEASSSSSSSSGGGVYIHIGTFTMSGGAVISGNSASSSSGSSSGGGVYVYETGKFTMEGGTIGGTGVASANSSESGGGVCVYKGDFTMSDGSISGNTVTQSGGGVFVQDGTFTMEGSAVIQGNKATSTNSHACGGGVYVNGGNFTMSGEATIQENNASTTDTNSAAGGGGVYVNGGTFTLTGTAKIQGNTTSTGSGSPPSGGGGVFVIAGGTFTMSGGTIGSSTDANKADLGGGVYVGVNTDTSEKGSFTMSGGTITGNTATQNGGGVYVAGGTFTVSGSSLTITGNTAHNVYLVNGNTITIGDKGLTGGIIGVTAENVPSGSPVQITNGDVNGTAGIFTSDNTAYSIVEYKGDVCLSDAETKYEVGADGTEALGLFKDAVDAVNASGGTITLLKDIDGSNAVFENDSSQPQPITFYSDDETRSFILDLNGKIINRELSTAAALPDGSVIRIKGGTLTIKDSSATNSDGTGGTGTITGGNTRGSGGGIHITSYSIGIGDVPGSLILESGSISGNTADSSNGGGIYIDSDCALTMKGGSIDGNIVSSADYYGGGVFVYGTFTMENGIITKNSSEQGNGGGVNIGSNGTFTMKGGTIENNTAYRTGGGVNLGAYGAFPGATMTLEGGTISGNTATVNGGGVGVSVGTFTMNGGTIGGTEPNTAKIGGGVYVDGVNSNFIMTGGTISGNTATQKGGGVYVSSTSSFTLDSSSAAVASSPVISENTKTDDSTNNVYLDNTSHKTLFITGELKKTEVSGNIGISLATPQEFTSGWSTSGSTDSAFFFSDDTQYNVKVTTVNGQDELCLVNPNLIFVKGGSCTLNGTEVTLSSFWISPYEVTQEEFESLIAGNQNGINANPSSFTSNPAAGEVQESRPVECVSWYDAIVYCNLLSIKEGLTPFYTIKGSTNPAAWGTSPTSTGAEDYADWESVTCNFNADGYRLPTEAEWEYAARGGQTGITHGSWDNTYSGSTTPENVAWYTGNSESKTHEVGKKQANALGLYDMSGNVWEWCWDLYDDSSSGYPSGTEDPAGPDTGSNRVIRGGSWYNEASNCTVSYQSNIKPWSRYNNYGFRLVRSIR